MKGETVGYTIGRNGLYLFIPSEKEKIIRCFVPYVSIKDYQIGPRIGELLIEQQIASKDLVDNALDRQHELHLQRIGDYLSENEVISREQLAKAIAHQERQPSLKLGERSEDRRAGKGCVST